MKICKGGNWKIIMKTCKTILPVLSDFLSVSCFSSFMAAPSRASANIFTIEELMLRLGCQCQGYLEKIRFIMGMEINCFLRTAGQKFKWLFIETITFEILKTFVKNDRYSWFLFKNWKLVISGSLLNGRIKHSLRQKPESGMPTLH